MLMHVDDMDKMSPGLSFFTFFVIVYVSKYEHPILKHILWYLDLQEIQHILNQLVGGAINSLICI